MVMNRNKVWHEVKKVHIQKSLHTQTKIYIWLFSKHCSKWKNSNTKNTFSFNQTERREFSFHKSEVFSFLIRKMNAFNNQTDLLQIFNTEILKTNIKFAIISFISFVQQNKVS